VKANDLVNDLILRLYFNNLYLLGVIKGDEIIKINNFTVKDLDSTKFNRYLNQIPIMLTLRSLRLDSTIKNPKETNGSSRSIVSNTNNEQPVQKIIFELIQTERSYVQVSE
jgi:hypothetical protein